MNLIFRLLLTFNATSLLAIVFLVQKKYKLTNYFPEYFNCLTQMPDIFQYLLYLTMPLALTFLSLMLCPLLGKDQLKAGEVVTIEHANNSFLPSYLGYFFVALSIANLDTLFFVYGLLFVFTFLSQALYFNPLFLVFGFKFYNIVTKKGASIFLISRKNYKLPKEIDIDVLYRINNYTFIEKG